MASIGPGDNTASSIIAQDEIALPEGLLGEIATYFFNQAPYPNKTIALAGAIGFLSGVVGQKYNTPTGNGLNTYNLVLAHTGRGKEAIAEGADKLLQAIVGKVEVGEPGAPRAAEFRLPGHFASPEGLMKWLANKSSRGFSIQGEFAAKVKAMHSPRAHANQTALLALYLDLFNKSGDGKFLNGMAYSDEAKNTVPVESPALTIIGESTFDLFEGLDQRAISNGFLPRFNVFQTEAPRPYLNPNVGAPAPYALVERLRSIAATCASYSAVSPAIRVTMDAEAQARLVECERQATDFVNAGGSNVHAELWNRAYLKAVKLASLQAVGVNEHAPVIDLKAANFAIQLVANQTNWLTKRFESGDVGEVDGNQTKQVDEVIRVVREYLSRAWPECEKYHGDQAFHKDGVITFAHIQQRLSGTAAFRNDRLGAQAALERTVKFLLSSFVLREVPHKQMLDTYGKAPRGFCVSDPKVIINGLKP